MNFDEFAYMAEANAKTWCDNYYDMCANEEFGFTTGIVSPSNISSNTINRSSDQDNTTPITTTNLITTTTTINTNPNQTNIIMQKGNDSGGTSPTTVPVSILC